MYVQEMLFGDQGSLILVVVVVVARLPLLLSLARRSPSEASLLRVQRINALPLCYCQNNFVATRGDDDDEAKNSTNCILQNLLGAVTERERETDRQTDSSRGQLRWPFTFPQFLPPMSPASVS